MGFSLSWVAVKGGTPKDVLNELGLRPTGERSDIAESAADGVSLSGGWYVVVSNHNEVSLHERKKLKELSSIGEVVLCFVEEHVMFSSAAGWRDGTCTWTVEHDAQKSVHHLDVKGEPPPAFDEIYSRLAQEQNEAGGKKAGVDFIFDVPIELAKALTGFVHSEDPPGLVENEGPFGILESTRPEPKSIWKRLFGG